MDIEKLSLAKLVALYNKHSGKPVKKFASRKDALRRVRAVLPAAKGKGGTAVEQLVEVLLGGQRTVEQIKSALKLDSTHAARMTIDRARRAGHKISNVARGTFAFQSKRGREPARRHDRG